MSFLGVLFFSIIQLLFFSGLVFVWLRVKKESSDDSRWSRNLQILQSKIAIFEDLSDRTETQVNQLTIMLENKICDLQRKIDEADNILNKISTSMKKSMEVAQIFQDKIPHEEIIERQNTVKFVRAALMAHQGKTVDEIAQVIPLPQSQIEFIVKVNAQRLSFDPSQMPDWLKAEMRREEASGDSMISSPSVVLMRSPLRPLNQLLHQRLAFVESGDSLKVDEQESKPQEIASEGSQRLMKEDSFDEKSSSSITGLASKKSSFERVRELGIRPVVFPRIESPVKSIPTTLK